MESKVYIVVPTIVCQDLLTKMLNTIDHPEEVGVIVLDNANKPEEIELPTPPNVKMVVVPQEINRGVAGSWNIGLKRVFNRIGADIAIVANDDLLFQPGAIQNVLDIVEKNPADIWVSTEGWSFFVIPKKTYNMVGEFDEMFYPGYFEDDDYDFRLFRMGMKKHIFPAKIRHLKSMSIRREPSLNAHFLNNRELYIQKWGGVPRVETHENPFDNKKIPLTYTKQTGVEE